jgi:potassium/hydrogen antiporter
MIKPMLFFFASLVVAAIFSTKITSRFGVPVLIAFIGLGLLVGSDVLNLFYFDDAALTKEIADILLIFILFMGGFQVKRSSLKAVAGPALALSTLGVLLTAVLLGLLIHVIAGYPLPYSLMIASIIASTDAAAVMIVTKGSPIRERVSTTLEVESAANDPIAIILTLAFVKIVAGQSGSPAAFALDIVWQLGGGVLVAFVCSKASRFLFDRLESENRGYYYVLIVGVILMTYGLAGLVKANGIIAVFFMGYWLGNSEFVCKRGVSNFLEGISAFANLALFLMLGLLAFPHNFANVWKEGLLISILMIFAVRPVAVLACTLPFRYTMRERLFIMWGGIKGAVPIVLASYPAVYGLDPSGSIFNIIFFAVLLSCLVQGSTMGPLARLLKLTVPAKPHSPYSVELHSLRKSDTDMFEIRIDPGSVAEGRCIRDLGLPADVLISSIVRRERIILPKGSTGIAADDLLFVLAPKGKIDEVSRVLAEPRREQSEAEIREMEIESRR